MTALPKNLEKPFEELLDKAWTESDRNLLDIGFTAGALEVMKMAEKLAGALEMMEAGYAGMFGHQGASPEVDCWERWQQIVSNALKEFREWRGEK